MISLFSLLLVTALLLKNVIDTFIINDRYENYDGHDMARQKTEMLVHKLLGKSVSETEVSGNSQGR